LREAQELLPEIRGVNLDLMEIQELDATKIIRAKLAEAQRSHTGRFIVEDTSLYLDEMNGLPGPLIKW
jgi:inosine/xanthosine triphosphate pyrophosphatase family protein